MMATKGLTQKFNFRDARDVRTRRDAKRVDTLSRLSVSKCSSNTTRGLMDTSTAPCSHMSASHDVRHSVRELHSSMCQPIVCRCTFFCVSAKCAAAHLCVSAENVQLHICECQPRMCSCTFVRVSRECAAAQLCVSAENVQLHICVCQPEMCSRKCPAAHLCVSAENVQLHICVCLCARVAVMLLFWWRCGYAALLGDHNDGERTAAAAWVSEDVMEEHHKDLVVEFFGRIQTYGCVGLCVCVACPRFV
jgi:hypothetical protein